MKEFFYLEGIYLIIAFFILLITIFVTTRSFMPKNALKKGLLYTTTLLSIFIIGHFIVTKQRMQSVKEAFYNNKTIICENRIYTKGANFVEIKNNGLWKLINNNFSNPHYSRDFFIARCFVK
jgi:glucan phosphoethanolaminetransferase (alkaline phosphatase superfamily)